MELDAAMATVRALFDAAVARVDVAAAVRRSLRLDGDALVVESPSGTMSLPLMPGGRVLVVAVGKAAAAMAAAAEEVLGERLGAGLAITKYGHGGPVARVEVREAGHPTPDEAGLAAARELGELLAGTTEHDVVVCLISGGGSALLTAPAEEISLADLRATTAALLEAGATINELNAVRKHLETLKGGGLARAAAPAPVVALAVSDVIGDPLDVIASGPTVGDTSTFAEAWAVIERRGLADSLPASVVERLQAGLRGEIPDTPRLDDPLFARVHTAVIANLRLAAEGAAQQARELGYATELLSLTIEGEAREVGRVMAGIALQVRRHGQPLPPPCVLLSGGETTVTVRATGGRGGRNTEFLLGLAIQLRGVPGVWALAADTDGIDGSEADAGAIVTPDSLERARALGLSPTGLLAANDAWTFFEGLGDLVTTGPTLTNVNDFRAVLVAG